MEGQLVKKTETWNTLECRVDVSEVTGKVQLQKLPSFAAPKPPLGLITFSMRHCEPPDAENKIS